jgi:fermentation-respiration switch protein FrsA (DUF1100 family)
MESRDETAHVGRPTSRGRNLLSRIRRLLVIVAVTYLGVCALVTLFQTRLIYYPSRDYFATPADVGLAYEDLTLKTRDGVSIAAWFVSRDDAKATILFCHGNAGNLSNRLHAIKLLHEMEYNVLIFDYRGFGRSEGRPGEKGTYLDADAAWEYLIETRAERPERVVVFGRSLGGAVAIELARRHRPAALVVESTFTRMNVIAGRHYPFLPTKLLLLHRYDSINKVPAITCPKLFLHGADDRLIPLADARRLYEAAIPPKQFIETPGGHNRSGFTYQDKYAQQAAAFIDEAVAAQK